MDVKVFLVGVGFLLLAYIMYYFIKGEKIASKETNWKGQLMPSYFNYWGGIVIAIITGIAFILVSFP